MANEWVGVINTTAPKYLKGAEDATMRDRLILMMLRQKGRIFYGVPGGASYQMTWQIEFLQPPVESYPDGGLLNFSRHDLYRQLTIDWRGYMTTDTMTTKENYINAGDMALIRRYDRIIPNLVKSLRDTFCGEFFIDGSAAGNENRLHGMETFLAAANSAAGNRLSTPNDTYGGLNTNLADQGGTWSSDLTTSPNATLARDWPDGSGTSDYDFLAPKLINWSSTAWGTGDTTWESNCDRVIRQGVIWLTTTGGKEGRPDHALLSPNLFYEYKNKQAAQQRIIIPHREAEDLGFGDVLNQEGVMISADFDTPANTGYLIDYDKMKLYSLAKVLFDTWGPDFSHQTHSYLFSVGFFGNAQYSPKHFAKLNNYA